jgi:hypothetical protein
MNRLDIHGVVELCTRMHATSRGLFEIVGRWVASTDDPELQRTFAIASHRHAWHAELWADRLPSIPSDTEPPRFPIDLAGDDHAAAYRAALVELIAQLGEVDDRIDAELDPSTARTIALVTSDLHQLRARLT